MVTIKLKHCRKAGYCLDGIKQFCALKGFSFPDLVKKGLEFDENEQLDPQIKRLVIISKEDNNGK